MIQWLYRYVFRGFGIVMLIGMITILLLAIHSQVRRMGKMAPAMPAGARR